MQRFPARSGRSDAGKINQLSSVVSECGPSSRASACVDAVLCVEEGLYCILEDTAHAAVAQKPKVSRLIGRERFSHAYFQRSTLEWRFSDLKSKVEEANLLASRAKDLETRLATAAAAVADVQALSRRLAVVEAEQLEQNTALASALKELQSFVETQFLREQHLEINGRFTGRRRFCESDAPSKDMLRERLNDLHSLPVAPHIEQILDPVPRSEAEWLLEVNAEALALETMAEMLKQQKNETEAQMERLSAASRELDKRIVRAKNKKKKKETT